MLETLRAQGININSEPHPPQLAPLDSTAHCLRQEHLHKKSDKTKKLKDRERLGSLSVTRHFGMSGLWLMCGKDVLHLNVGGQRTLPDLVRLAHGYQAAMLEKFVLLLVLPCDKSLATSNLSD